MFYKFLLDNIILDKRATFYYYLYSVLSSEKRFNDFRHDGSKPALDEIVDNYENRFELNILGHICIFLDDFSG